MSIASISAGLAGLFEGYVNARRLGNVPITGVSEARGVVRRDNGRANETAAPQDTLELSTQASQQISATTRTELSEEEQAQVDELKQRDRAVRAHEQAHLAAAGGYAKGGANYSYQTGPDGKSYAVGGEVQIDVSPIDGDPDATIRKMRQVQAAALAPADPSSQDRAVAAQATAAIREAQAELNEQQNSTNESETTTANSDDSSMQSDAASVARSTAPADRRFSSDGQALTELIDTYA